jgi:hypothetical protein
VWPRRQQPLRLQHLRLQQAHMSFNCACTGYITRQQQKKRPIATRHHFLCNCSSAMLDVSYLNLYK